MRLIDADALIAEYDRVHIGEPGKARKLIEDAPTIEPERTGKWIIKDNPGTGWYRVTCSECGEDVTSVAPIIGFLPDAKCIWNFCPNCGARMERRTDEPD